MDPEPGTHVKPRSPRGVAVALVLGGAWGLAGYLLLWGHTPLVVQRAFVVSPAGTLLLLPVRVVLAGIRFVEERVVNRTFEFAANNWWIGLLAAVVGAVLAALMFVVVRWVVRRVRRPAGS